MQRRAVAVYATLFLLLAVGAYGTLATAHAPTMSFGDPAYELETGDTVTVADRTYEVTDVAVSESSGDGHGGGGGTTHTVTLAWTNESARYTDAWSAGDEVDVDGTTFAVTIPNASDPMEVTLRETLPDDVDTYEEDERTYVVVSRDGNRTLVPLESYTGVERRTYTEGDTFEYDGNQITVGNVTPSSVPIEWTAPRTNEQEASEGGTVDLGDRSLVAHFPSDDTVQLVSESAYEQQQNRVEAFQTRKNGLWGVTILGGFTTLFLIGLAFLPTRR